MPFPESSFNIMFTIVPIIVGLGFVLVFGIIIFNIVKGVKTWSHNNSQPVLTVPAKVVSKRSDISSRAHHDSDGIGHHHRTRTTYFVTFEVESGDRIEFHVKDNEYGVVIEGDNGKLTFQGTRYLGFKRRTENSV